jgi:hypothetical protein
MTCAKCDGRLRDMLLPTALLVSRYRAFAADEVLPLRPLTLLFGRNNSGKSALSRALPMIGAFLTDDPTNALAVPAELLRGGSFTDLAWQGDAGDYSFDIGLCWSEGDVREARYTLDGSLGRAPYVKELIVKGANDDVLWAGRAPPGRAMRSEIGDSEVRFIGLIPCDTDVRALQMLATNMTELRGRIRWLESVRARPPRTVIKTGTPPSQLASNGSNAAEFLVEIPDLAESIRDFYLALSPPRELDVQEVLDVGHRIGLSPTTRPSFRVDLVDTGEGMAQVLPVLVAAQLAARQRALLVIEEPESHLHPDAQTVLSQYLCKLVSSVDYPTLIIETHSRVFLLGVQLAIASGMIPCDRAQLAWIDQDSTGRSTITPIAFSSSGHPEPGWPIAALGEDFKLAAQLAKFSMTNHG